MRKPFCRSLTFALAASLLFACSRQSPEAKLLDTAKPAVSWVAALQMTGERWIANSVPASFVEATVAAARSDLDKTAEDASKSQARPELRLSFRQLLQKARSTGLGLKRAVDAGNRPGVARRIEELKAIQTGLAAWQRQAGKAGGAP